MLWKDPAGRWHRVTVLEQHGRTSTIEYLDNTRRGETIRRGRRYNHATRVRVRVWTGELRDVPQILNVRNQVVYESVTFTATANHLLTSAMHFLTLTINADNPHPTVDAIGMLLDAQTRVNCGRTE